MIKAALVLASLLALGFAARIPQNDNDDQPSGCLYQDEMWGSEDGTKWYVCISQINTAIEFDCPENSFFVRNSTASGCVPLDLVNPACTGPTEVGPCTGENLKQPQPSHEPTKYYLCRVEDGAPLLLSCPAGTAFINQGGYQGCFEWPHWRELRDCPK